MSHLLCLRDVHGEHEGGKGCKDQVDHHHLSLKNHDIRVFLSMKHFKLCLFPVPRSGV